MTDGALTARPPSPRLWTGKRPGDGWIGKTVDDGWLVYIIESGETQLLSHLSRFIVEWLNEAGTPLSSAAIAQALQAEIPEASPLECATAAETSLCALLDAGLVIASPLAT